MESEFNIQENDEELIISDNYKKIVIRKCGTFDLIDNVKDERIFQNAFWGIGICDYRFSANEFIPPLDVSALCNSVSDVCSVYLSSPINTIDWLNELLHLTDLYKIMIKEKVRPKYTNDILKIERKTKHYRKKKYDELNEEQQTNIVRFNRLLLEETFPKETPRSYKYIYSHDYELSEKQFCDGELLLHFVSAIKTNPQLHIKIILLENSPSIIMQLGIENTTGRNLAVTDLRPLVHDINKESSLFKGKPGILSFFNNGWQSWSPSYSLEVPCETPITAVDDAERVIGYDPVVVFDSHKKKYDAQLEKSLHEHFFISNLMTVITLSDRQTKQCQCLIIGFVTTKDQFSGIEFKTIEHDWLDFGVDNLTAKCWTDSFELLQGERIFSEKLFLNIDSNPLKGVETYANAIKTEMGVKITNSIPTGWCSWYHYFNEINEGVILDNLSFFQAHQDEKKIGDWLDIDESKFPHGMKWIAEQVKKAGFTPGIWIAPFVVQESSELFRKHKRWLIHDEGGSLVSAGHNWDDNLYGLDCSNPEVQDWLRKVFNKIVNDWGFTFIKIDFLYSAALVGEFHEKNLTRAQVYRRGLEIIRETVEERFILGCGAPIGPAVGIVDAMRIGPDTSSYWRTNKKSAPSNENAIRNILHRYFMHNYFWINDPDVLIARNKNTSLTLHEIYSVATVIGLSGGMLTLSDNMNELSVDRKELIKKIMPVYGKAATSKDFFKESIPQKIILPVTKHFDNWYVVGLFNWKDKCEDVALELEDLDLNSSDGREYHVYDFWQQKYMGKLSKEISFQLVPPHSVKLLCIREVTKYPTLLSTNVHITQGAVEILNIEHDAAKRQLAVDTNKLGKREGHLLFYFPDGLNNINEALLPAIAIDNHILSVEVDFKKENRFFIIYDLDNNIVITGNNCIH